MVVSSTSHVVPFAYLATLMSLSSYEQSHQMFAAAKRILVVFRQGASGDAIASSLALKSVLEADGKQVDIVSQGFVLPRAYRFLPGAESISPTFGHLKQFEIRINTKSAGLGDVSYHSDDDDLVIHVTPARGVLTRRDVRVAESNYLYDHIVMIGTPELTSLGSLYESEPNLFHTLPIINIDHRPDNEHVGHINLVDVTATSTAEIVYKLCQGLAPERLTDMVATTLLTGIITKTRSFKSGHVAPHTLGIAGELVKHGADRELVVANLFRTRTIAALKLWGKVLADMQHEPMNGLIWSSLTREDFVKTGASRDDLPDLFDELIAGAPEAKITLLLHEDPSTQDDHVVHGILRTEHPHSAQALLTPYTPSGTHKHAEFVVRGKPLKEVETDVVNRIKAVLV